MVWQLSVELRDRIVATLQNPIAPADVRFASQLEDAASSAPRNIAEGFGYFHPREFARFARVARGSLLETRCHLQDPRTLRYFKESEREQLLRLTGRAIAAITCLLHYLTSCQGKAGTGWEA